MLVVESARRSDLAGLLRLAGEALGPGQGAEWFQGLYRPGQDHLVVARDVATATVVGFVLARREPPCRGHILAIAVDRPLRGRGIGSALLREAMRSMGRTGALRLDLEARVDDDAAQGFYLRHGFRPEGLLAGAYSDGSDAVRYVRPI